MSTAPSAVRDNTYSFERTTVGGIASIVLHGTLNELFEGRKLANAIRGKKIVINLYDVRRFASWGMSEWMDFLRLTGECDLYLVECSTYALSQLNLVTGLLGHAKLVSFYASYRCTSCNEEMETRFIVPSSRATIPDIPNSYQECPKCAGRARLEEYPAAFFDTIATRPAFDIDDEVLAYMRGQLNYDLSPDLKRFRAYGKVQGEHGYIRLTGNLATLAPDVLARSAAPKTVLDVEGVVFDRSQLSAWRTYLTTVAPKVKSLQLLGCPPGFLEAAIVVNDLRDKVKVRTFATMFHCGTCDTTSAFSIDVAMNLEELAMGVTPAGRCPSCRSTLTALTTDGLIPLMRAFPARDRDVELDSFLSKWRSEPVKKLDNLLAVKQTAPAAPGRRRLYLAATVGLVMLGAGGGTVWAVMRSRHVEPAPITPVPPPTPGPGPSHMLVTRPDWLTQDVPSSGYCTDMGSRLTCVGVSSYRGNLDDGLAEATDVALDELVYSIALKIPTPYFRDTITTGYTAERTKALSGLQTSTVNRTVDAKSAALYVQTRESVRKTLGRVVEVLRATGGAAIPAQHADWWWEQYANATTNSTEFLVFVRYDISKDGVRTLVDKYSETSPLLGSVALTAFPALAWQYERFNGGVMLTKVGDPLARAGLSPLDLVVAVGDQRVKDTSSLARLIENTTGTELKLTVIRGNSPERVVTIKR
jgi:hypothetical protein